MPATPQRDDHDKDHRTPPPPTCQYPYSEALSLTPDPAGLAPLSRSVAKDARKVQREAAEHPMTTNPGRRRMRRRSRGPRRHYVARPYVVDRQPRTATVAPRLSPHARPRQAAQRDRRRVRTRAGVLPLGSNDRRLTLTDSPTGRECRSSRWNQGSTPIIVPSS